MVGDGHGGHFAPGGFVHQAFDVARAVEKTIVGVKMKVDESRGLHAEAILVVCERFRYRGLVWVVVSFQFNRGWNLCGDLSLSPHCSITLNLEKPMSIQKMGRVHNTVVIALVYGWEILYLIHQLFR